MEISGFMINFSDGAAEMSIRELDRAGGFFRAGSRSIDRLLCARPRSGCAV
jgi:hypothetical protein